jgi:hypothetical protein
VDTPPLVGGVGVLQGAVGVETVVKMAGDVAEAAGTVGPGHVEERGLGFAGDLSTDVLSAAGDHGSMLVADLAGGEGLGGPGQGVEGADGAKLLGGVRRGEPAPREEEGRRSSFSWSSSPIPSGRCDSWHGTQSPVSRAMRGRGAAPPGRPGGRG